MRMPDSLDRSVEVLVTHLSRYPVYGDLMETEVGLGRGLYE
jgi:hypothetical protein